MLLPRLNFTASFSILLPPSLRAVQGNGESGLWSFHSNLSLPLLILQSVLLLCGAPPKGHSPWRTAPVWVLCTGSGLLFCELPHGLRSCWKHGLSTGWSFLQGMATCWGVGSSMGCRWMSAPLPPPWAAGWHPWSSMWVTGDSGASISPPSPLILVSAELFRPHFFSLLIPTAAAHHFLFLPKHFMREMPSVSVFHSAVSGSILQLAGHRCSCSFVFSQTPSQHSLLLSTPCQ